jgi:hypothetical protein
MLKKIKYEAKNFEKRVLLHNGGFCNNCKTLLAQISAFPNKCTIKHPFRTTSIHEKSGNLCIKITHSVLSGKKLIANIILNQNHAWHITHSGLNNYLV